MKLKESNIRNNYFKNKNDFKTKMAFYYRYIDNGFKNKMKMKMKHFKTPDPKKKKMQMSKSIPNILLYEIKKMQKIKKKKDNSDENNNNTHNKSEEENYLNRNMNTVKGYGFSSSFKGNRYIGNLYYYYKSNSCLDESRLIFPYKPNNNNNKINEQTKLTNSKEKSILIKKKILNKIKNINIKKSNNNNSKIGIVQLSSLLL